MQKLDTRDDTKLVVFVAGSLREVLLGVCRISTAISGCDVQLELGPSCVLRERIEGGEVAHLFVTADHHLNTDFIGR